MADSDLPSQQSALRFADQGHVMSKSHVDDVLANSDRWDLHTQMAQAEVERNT